MGFEEELKEVLEESGYKLLLTYKREGDTHYLTSIGLFGTGPEITQKGEELVRKYGSSLRLIVVQLHTLIAGKVEGVDDLMNGWYTSQYLRK